MTGQVVRAGGACLACGLAVAAAAGIRDPFSPPRETRANGATPLQRLEIDQLRLTGLVYAPGARALLEDRVGIGYVAVPGTPVGPRGGTVVGIERGALRIRGDAAAGEIVLELRARDEGGR